MGLYLYAVLAARPGVRLGRGGQAEPLRAVRCGTLWAVVGEVEEVPPVEAWRLRAQDGVVRRLFARVDALLPAQFGTLVAGPRALAGMLEPRATALRSALAQVHGHEQVTVRLFGEATPRPAPPPPSGGVGTRYLEALARRRAWERSAPELAPLRTALARRVHAERIRRHDAPPLIASVYHLIPRGEAARYRRAVGRAARASGALRVRIAGPFPPYAFVPEER